MTLVIVIQLRAKSLQAADRVQHLLAGIRDTALLTEPGTTMYLTTRAQADPLEFLLFEEYVDELALKLHMSSLQFQALKEEADGLFVDGIKGLRIAYYDRF
ncbi:uncharacterized protein LOC62_02G003441 [Vanrija pseudolonga]|uniref:ABM domain-containing protein n=1 Tax=Vanrija pseudolonga TaxID=143232 RepID=A0AAF0Y4N2_9TREE|nr:hypothetical protein LOC62_02G003441 [Vanrija pseudolonga]